MNFLVRHIAKLSIATLILSLTACQASAPAPYKHFGQQGGASSAGVHIVDGGDTLYSISKRYRLAMQDVIYLNKLNAPYILEVGQRLDLPPPNTYTVKRGDTLYGIARTFNVSLSQLVKKNHISSPYIIHPGDELIIPSVRPQQNVQLAKASPSQNTSAPAKQTKKRSAPVPKSLQPPKRSSSKFQWPTEGNVLSSYGPKKGGLHNDGINILAPRGAPVQAAENGVVVYTGSELKGYGNLVLVKHEDRWMTAYAHLDKTLVRSGQVLKKGQSLGTVGSSGNVDKPQLHFEVRRGTNAINPMMYLAGRKT